MLQQLWILSMVSYILEWRHSSISFSLKNVFCRFAWKTIALIRFHVLVLILNHKSVFSRPDDVTSPHSLLRAVILLSILIENVCFSSSSRKTIVYICFHYFAVSSKQDNESLRFGWRHNDATSLYIKVTSGYRQFSTLWHIENNNQKPNLSQKKTPKDLK